jgi:outer membrane receptor protein involved in Fe transport
VEFHVRLILMSGLVATSAAGQVPAADDIIVHGRAIQQIGVATSGSEGTVGYRDFENRPLSRVGELAENVPGLIATQHSGTGKANQFFLRGFNLDHGTDLAGFVDGAPVNMRTHGHGQGYLDLNFLIPEAVERIDFAKGPYHADTGDFAAAGTLRFATRTRFDQPFAEVQAGQFGYLRGLAGGSTSVGDDDLLGVVEGTISSGPWDLDEELRAFKSLLKWSTPTVRIGLATYTARWNATDQVPERAIADGTIGRFGFIDPDLGGSSTRIALNLEGSGEQTRWSAYAIRSSFSLTSNFTYLLDDPVNGDQFIQRDRRWVVGGSVDHRLSLKDRITLRLGGDLRGDLIGKVGLYRSTAGVSREAVREDRVDQWGGGAFAEAEFRPTDTLRLVLGLRADAIGFDVRSDLAANSGSGSAAILAPKAALAWKAAPTLELYANYGEGYHSNDVRGAAISIDPATGDPAETVPLFARARGAELGARYEAERITLTAVGFWLHLESELVFVGDAGTTEPNDATRRFGGEFSLFWRPTDTLTLDAALSLTDARFEGVPDDRIPGSVGNVLSAGASWEVTPGLVATGRVRHFGAAPLIEDGSVRSDSTTLANLGGYWTVGRLRLGLDILNLLDAADPDISYFYASRLPGEPVGGVEDRHIHPVEPRQLRVSVRLGF